jgi:hypothetical protein
MPQGDASLAGGPPMGGEGQMPPGDPNAGGQTEKEMLAEMIAGVPIEQLMQLVQGSSPEELAQKITQAAIQSGMGQEEATAYSITLMKVIYERIQDETGKPITEISGQAQEPSLAGGPPPAPGGNQGAPVGQMPPMMGGMNG